MKNFFRSIIAPLFAVLARAVVRKYKPTIIMVTGSVGKTSTKDAIAAALSERTYLRASEKSYNSEFGVPLTIIGSKNPWTSPFGWLRVFREGLALLVFPNHYPKTLVLEVGADRPGDLAKILRIATPDVVVVTKLPEVPVHVEAYASPQAVRDEEFVPAYGLAPGSPLIVNAEDEYALAYARRLPASLSTFGFTPDADVSLSHIHVALDHKVPVGMQATVTIGEREETITVPNALGRQQLLAPAAALAVALALGENVADALKGLGSYASPPGRMRILKGREGSILIDDTYNSSPAAVGEALNALSLVLAKRRIAVLGDMLELGRYSIQEHERVGELVAQHADILVAVGIRSRATAEAAKKAGMKEEAVRICDNATVAAEELPTLIRTGDAVLVKGSQSIRTERIAVALLADPEDLSKLVRQEKQWKTR